MKSRFIVYLIIILTFVSFLFLAWAEKRQKSATNVWALYFENEKKQSADFVIINQSDKEKFQWKVKNKSRTLLKEEANIGKGESRVIQLPELDLKPPYTLEIEVSDGATKKKIQRKITN